MAPSANTRHLSQLRQSMARGQWGAFAVLVAILRAVRRPATSAARRFRVEHKLLLLPASVKTAR